MALGGGFTGCASSQAPGPGPLIPSPTENVYRARKRFAYSLVSQLLGPINLRSALVLSYSPPPGISPHQSPFITVLFQPCSNILRPNGKTFASLRDGYDTKPTIHTSPLYPNDISRIRDICYIACPFSFYGQRN